MTAVRRVRQAMDFERPRSGFDDLRVCYSSRGRAGTRQRCTVSDRRHGTDHLRFRNRAGSRDRLQLLGAGVDRPAALARGHAARRQSTRLRRHRRHGPDDRLAGRGRASRRGYALPSMRYTRDGEQRELRPVVIAQIESLEGLAQVDAIADVDGIDVLWIGQRDLSLALGVPGQFDSAPIVDAVRHIARAANDAGKSAGYLLQSPEHAQKLTALGYRWFGFSDTALYSCALGTRLQQVRDLLNGEMRR
jgi:HpcH/HpaI aldolase/citrate lyase family